MRFLAVLVITLGLLHGKTALADVTAGALGGLALDFIDHPTAGKGVAREEEPDDDSDEKRSKQGSPGLWTGGWVVFGVGGASLVAGAITGGMALSMDKNIAEACPEGECEEIYKEEIYKEIYRDLIDIRDSLATSAHVLLSVGGAAVAASIVMLVVAAPGRGVGECGTEAEEEREGEEEEPETGTKGWSESDVESKPAGRSGALRIGGWVVFSAGAAALLGSVVTGGIALSKDKQLKEDCVGSICKPEYRDELESRDNLALATNVLLAVGGAAAVAGTVMLTLSPKDRASDKGEGPMRLRGVAGPHSLMAVIEWEF